MLDIILSKPWTITSEAGFVQLKDNAEVVIMQYYEPHASHRVETIFKIMAQAPELYEAAKEIIELKKKLWYFGLDDIEKGVFDSVVAKFEIAIQNIEQEVNHGSRVNN